MTDRCVVLVNREQEAHRSPGHPERPQRVQAALEAIAGSELGLEPWQAEPAPAELIARAHDPAYVDLLYVSSHQYPFYPGTGSAQEQSEHLLNLPMPAGTSDVPFLEAYEQRVDAAIQRFRPQLLLVSAGFDAHAHDPLAGLELSTD